MKIFKRVFLIFILIFSFAEARATYTIENLDIVARIQRDGSIEMEEQILYDIDKIHGIYYNIDALGYGKLENLEIWYQDGNTYKKGNYSRYQNPGDYSISIDDELYKIKLYAPSQNEKRSFIFKYTLPRGIVVYRDIAQLNRKMVGKNWDSSIKNIDVKVFLPQEVKKDKIYAYAHGPLTGNIKIVNGKEIEYTLKNYRPGEFLEVNLLFPKEILTEFNPLLIKNEKALNRIVDMETQLAKEANEIRRTAMFKFVLGRVVLGVAFLWWIFLLIFIYLKNGKRYKVQNEYGEYFRELPDDFSPAVAGTLISRRLYPEARELFASLLDLVRKGYLELEERENKNILILKEKDGNELNEYERYLLNWYIRELGDGEKLILEDLEIKIKTRSNAKEFNGNLERWKTLVYSDMLSKGLKDDKKDKFSTTLGVITGVAYFVGGGFFSSYFGTPYMIFLTAMGFILFPYTFSKRRPSLEKEKAICRWNAFKKFLVDYSNLEEAKLASIHLWEHYFVYAVALGVAEKVAKGYKKLMKSRPELEGSRVMGSYRGNSLMNLYLYSNLFNNLEKTTENVVRRSIESVARSNRSSSMGRGGGFSGGSSGGGGGRGGGGAF